MSTCMFSLSIPGLSSPPPTLSDCRYNVTRHLPTAFYIMMSCILKLSPKEAFLHPLCCFSHVVCPHKKRSD